MPSLLSEYEYAVIHIPQIALSVKLHICEQYTQRSWWAHL